MIPLSCKLKLKTPFYFIFCKFYVAARGFEKRTAFYPAKTSHNTNPVIVSITPLSGPSVANIFASLMQRDRHPQPLYMVQAICQAWNQSRVNAQGRSGAASSNITATLNEYTWEGNE